MAGKGIFMTWAEGSSRFFLVVALAMYHMSGKYHRVRELEKCLRETQKQPRNTSHSQRKREVKQVQQEAELPGENSFPRREDPTLAGKPRNPKRLSPQGAPDAEAGLRGARELPLPAREEGD